MRRRAQIRLRIAVDGLPVGPRTHVNRGTPGLVVCESVVPELQELLRQAGHNVRITPASPVLGLRAVTRAGYLSGLLRD